MDRDLRRQLLRERDWAYGLVIVWAYVGIAVQQDQLVAVAGALVGAAVVAALVVISVEASARLEAGWSASSKDTSSVR